MKTKFYINDTLEKVIYSNESQFIYFGENLSLKHLQRINLDVLLPDLY